MVLNRKDFSVESREDFQVSTRTTKTVAKVTMCQLTVMMSVHVTHPESSSEKVSRSDCPD